MEITSSSQWELLNLDVDTVLKMPFEVEAVTRLEHQEFMEIMGSYLYESIGAQEFARRHELKNTACVLVPRTSHVSFAKAVTILGLGRESLIAVARDEDARMDPKGKFIEGILIMAQLCPNFEVTSYRDFSDLSSQDFLECGNFFTSIDFWASWLLESFCFHKACLTHFKSYGLIANQA